MISGARWRNILSEAHPASVCISEEPIRLTGSAVAPDVGRLWVLDAALDLIVAVAIFGELAAVIVDVLGRTLERVALRELLTPADVLESESEARAVAQSFIREA